MLKRTWINKWNKYFSIWCDYLPMPQVQPLLKLSDIWPIISHFYMDVITYPCHKLDVGIINMSVKRALANFTNLQTKLWTSSSPFYYHGLTLIPSWISNCNYIHSKVLDEITYSFLNFNACTVEVWEWLSNVISHLTRQGITYPLWE